jgi:hypothetical protein
LWQDPTSRSNRLYDRLNSRPTCTEFLNQQFWEFQSLLD